MLTIFFFKIIYLLSTGGIYSDHVGGFRPALAGIERWLLSFY